MADFELHGYLTTGKFQVNDYEIEIERVEGGMRMRVKDGMGKVQEAMVKDGASEISNDDAMTIREMFDALSNAFPEWQKNEQDRKNAERDRAAAESARYNTFRQMQEALSKFDIDAINGRLDAVVATANGAANTANGAEITANNAYNSVSGILGQLFYNPGDVITIGDSGTAQSTSLNASGYVTGGLKRIHIKFPVAKRLDNISTVTCDSFIAHIINSGGAAMSASDNDGGYQYIGNIESVYADKVQNCIHVIFSKSDGFTLSENECVSARIGNNRNGVPAVKFTLG